MTRQQPSFEEVFVALRQRGPALVRSSRNTEYTVEAGEVGGQPAIIGFPGTGRVVIHADCWLENITCQGTRAGGLYNGPVSILDWYSQHSGNA